MEKFKGKTLLFSATMGALITLGTEMPMSVHADTVTPTAATTTVAPAASTATTGDATYVLTLDQLNSAIISLDGYSGTTEMNAASSLAAIASTMAAGNATTVNVSLTPALATEAGITVTPTPTDGTSTVTAKYVDQAGNSIAPDVVTTGNVGDAYSTTQEVIPGYTFSSANGGATSAMYLATPITITYIYNANTATPTTTPSTVAVPSTITASTGTPIDLLANVTSVSDDIGNLADKNNIDNTQGVLGVTVMKNGFSVYNATMGTPGTTLGTYTPDGPGTYQIKYDYKYNVMTDSTWSSATTSFTIPDSTPTTTTSTVTAKYVDQNGNSIAPDVVTTGNVGDTYSTTQEIISGYNLTSIQGNATGTYTTTPTTITYEYTADETVVTPPVQTSTVTVHYVDLNGKTISPDEITTGNVGDPYVADLPLISGYYMTTFPDGWHGNYTSSPIDVTYVYQTLDDILNGSTVTPAATADTTAPAASNVAAPDKTTTVKQVAATLPATGIDATSDLSLLGMTILGLGAVAFVDWKAKNKFM